MYRTRIYHIAGRHRRQNEIGGYYCWNCIIFDEEETRCFRKQTRKSLSCANWDRALPIVDALVSNLSYQRRQICYTLFEAVSAYPADGNDDDDDEDADENGENKDGSEGDHDDEDDDGDDFDVICGSRSFLPERLSAWEVHICRRAFTWIGLRFERTMRER